MKILYFGKICEEDLFNEKEKKGQPFFVAQYMFEKALYGELEKNKDLDIEVISIYQTEYFPNDRFLFNRKSIKKNKFSYLKFINLPYLRELSYFISSCFYIVGWFIKNRKESNKCIYSSCHFPPVSLAIIILGKMLSIKKVVTFTDLSLFTYSKEKIKNMKIYKRILMKPYVSLVNKLQKGYDAYILFSKQMNQIVNLKKNPFLVIEGIYNSDHLNFNERTSKTNSIAHAGTLNREVGIEKILDVFNLIENQDLELWLIGKGDMTEEIIRRSRYDKRIKYLGFMSRDQVFEQLKKANLLINLRNPNDIYTKYSFPSKMFEYMASATPVLTTKIEGIPDEYYSYLYTVDSYNDEDIKNRVTEIFNVEKQERRKLGLLARKYVLDVKNSKEQATKILKFIKSL